MLSSYTNIPFVISEHRIVEKLEYSLIFYSSPLYCALIFHTVFQK